MQPTPPAPPSPSSVTPEKAEQIAALAASLLRVFEGLRLAAYRDSGGIWTIGFGHTGSEITPISTITASGAAALLAHDSLPLIQLVGHLPTIAAAAYLSFGYNCGRHALELVLAGKANLLSFTHDHHGHTQPGLEARRLLEHALISLADPPLKPGTQSQT